MRILFIIEDLGPGGAQRQIVNLALDFKKRGMNVSFLTFYHKEFYIETIQEVGINYHCIPIKNPIKRIVKFRKFIRSGSYDNVIAFLGIPVFLSELAAIPYKNWNLIVGERSANPKILTSKYNKFLRLFHVFADHVVSNSYHNLEMIRKVNTLLSKRKCHVIYNAIDLEKYQPNQEFIYKKNDRLKIVIPATYRRLKNLLGLVEAVGTLSESEKKKIQIDWYGDKKNYKNADFILPQAENRISELGLNSVFNLNDATLNIQHKIIEADVVGLFSYFEGLPNAICEGMSCGKPIIATAVSDIPLLIEDEINGKLCTPFEINTIAEALRFFIGLDSNELKKMGELNRKKAEKLFESDIIVQQYIDLLK